MRMTKKITSIVLAVLMVVSMMSVMAVSANAVATEISDSMGLYNACLNGGEYVLTADITTEYNWVENDTIINGNGHKITSTTADGYTMFYWDADKDADLTLTNVTLDGNNKAGNAVDVTPYPSNSNNSGCNVNFDTVTVKNFVSQFDQGVGAVYLFGKSNGSFTNCTFENNTVSTNGSNGFSGADIWCGGGGELVISGGSYNEVYVNGGTANATISNGAVIDSMAAVSTSTVAVNDSTVSKLYVADINNVTVDNDSTVTVCNAFKPTEDEVLDTYGVAQIGSTKYATLEAAFAAAVDGDTIKVLADCAGNGIKVTPAGKFATGLTVDFGGHTYTVDGETVGSPGTQTLAFQLLKNNKVTFKNGTIYSEKAKMLVQNYCNLTLDNMTLTLNNTSYNGAYTLSNNNGNTVIKDTTINANPTTGSFAFDVCRGGGSNSYPSVNVTVTGDSEINGDVEVYARNSDPKDGLSLTLESGTMNGDIVVDPTAQNVIDTAPDKIEVTKKSTFDQAAPENFVWKDNGNGTQSLVLDNPLVPDMITAAAAKAQDGNEFGITSKYLKGTLLGVQKKTVVGEDTSSQEGEKNIRFVAVLDTDLIQAMQDADDYGFVLAKANNTNKTYADINYDAIKAGDDRVKTISARGTYNNVCGTGDYSAYGDPSNLNTDYKYITCAVNNVTSDDKVIARFYYKKDGKTYYAKYAGHNYQYTGCMAAWSDLA